jgi:small GTP-binding protein
MSKTSLINDLLANLLKEVPDLTAALVVDVEGLIIAQQSIKGFDEEIIGAIMGVLEQTISKIKKFAKTSFGSGTFDANEFRLFYLELRGSIPARFVLVADPYVNMDQFIPFSYIVAEKVSLILSDRETSILLPKFSESGDIFLTPQEDSISSKNVINQLFVIGSERGGKSSLIEMYINGKFEKNYKPTIGLSIFEKKLQITKRTNVILYIFDMGGLKSFAKIRKYYYKISNPKAIIILFDYSRIETLESVNEWLKEAKFFVKDNPILYVLVGNKIDLVENREEIKKKAEQIANKNNCLFFETSALTGEGIDEVFMYLAFN